MNELVEGVNKGKIKNKKDLQTTLDSLLGITKTKEVTISDEIMEIFTKNRTHHKIKEIDQYVTPKQINKIYNEIKDQFPQEFSEQSIKEIIKIQQAFKKDAKEHGCVINLKNGNIFNPRDGKNSAVTISYSGIDDMENLASIHNHPIHGFNAPSDTDIDNMLKRKHEKYCIVLSENKVWIVKNKYYNIDLKEKGNSLLFTKALIMEDNIKNTFNKNKIDTVNDILSIENINSKVDKELIDIFERNNFISKVITIK